MAQLLVRLIQMIKAGKVYFISSVQQLTLSRCAWTRLCPRMQVRPIRNIFRTTQSAFLQWSKVPRIPGSPSTMVLVMSQLQSRSQFLSLRVHKLQKRGKGRVAIAQGHAALNCTVSASKMGDTALQSVAVKHALIQNPKVALMERGLCPSRTFSLAIPLHFTKIKLFWKRRITEHRVLIADVSRASASSFTVTAFSLGWFVVQIVCASSA
jgi:hypothetical protein